MYACYIPSIVDAKDVYEMGGNSCKYLKSKFLWYLRIFLTVFGPE